MAEVPIPWGAWEPDKAPHMSPSLTEAVNVLSVGGAYAPLPGLFPTPSAILPGPTRGFFSIPLPDGTPLVYGATYNNIYRLSAGAALVYSGGSIADAYWRFVQFQGRTIAINPNVNPLGATSTGSFTALGGTPPRAKVVGVVGGAGDFLVLGNLQNDGVDGFQPNRIRWSGFDNPDTWGTNVGTQADFQPMPDQGGPVIAITGREVGTVFQRKMMSRMQYVGPPNVFEFSIVSQQRGAISAGAVCDVGDLVGFIADDGLFLWDGQSVIPIGSDRVNRWFRARLDWNKTDAIVSGFDPQNRCIWWAFPELGKSTIQTALIYSLDDQRFTSASLNLEAIGASFTLPTALENMPTPDTFGGSFDDPAYAGGVSVFAGIDTNHQYGTFTGQTLPATLATGDFQSAAGSRTFCSGVRPLIDSVNATAAVGERMEQPGDPVSWGSDIDTGITGVAPQRIDGRYLRYRVKAPAGDNWTRTTGIEVSIKQTGRR